MSWTSFIKPTVNSTVRAMKVQYQLDASAKDPFERGTQAEETYSLAGVIKISSPQFQGAMAVCLNEPLFLELLSFMLGQQVNVITKDMLSAAGELMNIIFGIVKTVMNQEGFDLAMALPKVVEGDSIKSIHQSGNRIGIIPFNTKKGTFQIEISLESNF